MPISLTNRLRRALRPQKHSPKVRNGISAPKLPYPRTFRDTKDQEFTEKRNTTRNHELEEEVAAPIATSSGTLSSLASCGWPSARTRSESTCFRRIRLRNPPPHPLPPQPLVPASNAIKIAGDADGKGTGAGFDQKAAGKGIGFRVLRGRWTERESGREGDGEGESSAAAALPLTFWARGAIALLPRLPPPVF